MNKEKKISPIRQIIGQVYWLSCWILLISDKNLTGFRNTLFLVGMGLLISGVAYLLLEVYAVLRKKKKWSTSQLSPAIWLIIIAASKYWNFDRAIIAVYFILIFLAVTVGLLQSIKRFLRYMKKAYREISQKA